MREVCEGYDDWLSDMYYAVVFVTLALSRMYEEQRSYLLGNNTDTSSLTGDSVIDFTVMNSVLSCFMIDSHE